MSIYIKLLALLLPLAGALQADPPSPPATLPVAPAITSHTRCADDCANAIPVTLDQPLFGCAFSEPDETHWFRALLPPGRYRFQLDGLPGGADYDLYSFTDCGDAPGRPTDCTGNAAGPEDFTCTIQGGPLNLLIAVQATSGPFGDYTLRLSKIGGPETIVGTPILFSLR